ncbi:MAG: ornithine carbamoyltransferase [Candidatus Thermoplasmatota archaeon]|jgi:ornithine carbamoyltransferase|nr:ornithine carbamoyltransferase [Candidatus Thermoplasmatota archaeon]
MKRDIISVLDMKDDMSEIIDLAIRMKRDRYTPHEETRNRVLGMIFEKPSTRTRISLETAMIQLGGHAIYLNPNDMQIGRGETIADTASVISRFLDVISYRAFKHENMLELARYSSVPVINALDDREHPTQILADFMTVLEKKGKYRDLKFSYVGDGNNMANSLMLGAALLGIDISIGCPPKNAPDRDLTEKARKIAKDNGSTVEIMESPVDAVSGADIVYTDVWISMGEESIRAEKEKLFGKYQVNDDLVSHADKNYIFMHCLPAHRGLEVTDSVASSVNSVIFDEAENRMHSIKALIYTLLKS